MISSAFPSNVCKLFYCNMLYPWPSRIAFKYFTPTLDYFFQHVLRSMRAKSKRGTFLFLFIGTFHHCLYDHWARSMKFPDFFPCRYFLFCFLNVVKFIVYLLENLIFNYICWLRGPEKSVVITTSFFMILGTTWKSPTSYTTSVRMRWN